MDNTWTVFNGIVIGGLSSAWVTNYRKRREQVQSNERYPKVDEGYPRIPDTSWMDGFIAEKGYHILLCHHPEYYSLLPAVDLIISGHAHGGQWNIFGRGLYSSSQGLWPKYFAGIYHNKMVVSRGLINTHRRIPRFGNPTEIVYVKPVK